VKKEWDKRTSPREGEESAIRLAPPPRFIPLQINVFDGHPDDVANRR
jgi:hypothetical protein